MKIEQTVIDSIRSRPRFKIFTDISRENYTEQLKQFLAEKSENYSGNINNEAAIINVNTAAVWTFFMFLNFIFGILWMVFITIWFVEKQIKSNDYPWALSASFIILFLLLSTFAAARIGKIRAKKEMQKLREFAEESIRTFEKD